ncbi:hypothetical protein RN001_009064 [Aquatica leii]|uniref:Uncharacterized protein n=1 Tax=Aquatica leii TaxID=1421715 RepID=A0AAN7QFP0_9COLE|nr:hypothetical protein RN001_009064 [Aquatica leii]
MYKLCVVAVLLFVAVSAEDDSKSQPKSVTPYNYHNTFYPHNYGAYHQLDAYKYNPYSYDATKYPYHHGGYPYSQHTAYPYHSGYPYQQYNAFGHHYPYSSTYTSSHLKAKH